VVLEREVADLAAAERAVADAELPALRGAPSFRVTSVLSGDPRFSRMDLQRAAGAVLQRRYGTPVDLEGYAVNVRVDVHGTRLVVGLQCTRTPLGKRIRRPRALRTSIKPTIAAAMLRLAGAHREGGRLIDPLCGSGTIPVEAKRINPRLAVFALDWDPPTVEVARGTAANHELAIDVREGDARQLRAIYPDPFDYIVTDPPFGVRLGRRSSIRELYRNLLVSFETCLAPRGTVAIVILKLRAFRAALEETGLHVVHERLVESGGLHPRIFLLSHG
jgi:23S rRNA G2445 N2-methylase RlmL